MIKKSLSFAVLCLSLNTHAAIVTWELVDFQFNDGGAAYGSFVYNTDTDQLSNIDIYTTAGSTLNGRHYIATAGAWGANPESGTLAFTDTSSADYTGAGWFRISQAFIDYDAQPGDIVTQWLAVGAESFCINSNCSSAANEITNPGESRDTLSGHLVAVSNVPVPAAAWLFGSSLLGLAGLSRRSS